MKKFLVAMCAMSIFAVAFAEDAKKEEKFTATCPVSGKAAVKEKSADYKGGKVYFCCGNCAAAYEKDAKAFSTKSNFQLVQTKQAKQEKCPISGGATKSDKIVKIADVEVAFCCGNCTKKVSEAKEEEQLELAFSDEAFEKAFKVPEAKEAAPK